mgnify:CR=1 FL=1
MKWIKGMVALASVAVLMVYSNCGGGSDPAPPVTDVQLEKLRGTWVIQSVTGQGTNRTSEYPGFSLTFTGTNGNTTFNYTAANRPALSPWPPSGTFTFDTETPESSITRNDPSDPIDVSYEVTATQLTLEFNYQGGGFTRPRVVEGDWTFTFTKQ